MSILKVIWLEVAWLEKSGQSRAPSLQINPAAISKTQIDRENKHFDHKTLPKNNMVTTWLLQVLLVGFNFHELDSIFNKNRCEVFPKVGGTYTIEEAGEIPLDDLSGSVRGDPCVLWRGLYKISRWSKPEGTP